MNILTKRVRGMQDVLPEDFSKWKVVEYALKSEAESYGFKEIRTPVLEHTELFARSSGDTSDVVQKEMYTFQDKSGRSITLRPEGTAGAMRLVLENGLHSSALPLKFMYFSSFYRYDKPQSGRFREFFQFACETFGADSPLADAEIMLLVKSIFERLGIEKVRLEINSLGCQKCKVHCAGAVEKYFKENESKICKTCSERLKSNPLRIFDCKNETCKEICKDAPSPLDFICDECKTHFESVQKFLKAAGVEFTLNPRIVRGLDYYTKTIFEFVYYGGETELTACGGGRYDALSREFGGPDMPALGFGIGVERVLMIMENQKAEFPKAEGVKIYIAPFGEGTEEFSLKLAQDLRKSSIKTEININKRGIKAQVKYADKIGAEFLLVIGEEELKTKKAKIKKMSSGEESEIRLDENFISRFMDIDLKK